MNKKEQCSVMVPNQPGMKVTKIHRDFEYKKLLHPDTYGKNKSRSKGTSHKKIEDFTRIIKNGQYTPEHHIAPTVSKIKGTKWYDLTSGKHRVSGHECAGKETMYVIEIEFFDFNGKPAKYWEAMWRNNENREDDLEPGHVDSFDSYETANLESFKEDPILPEEGEKREEDLGDFDPSLN